MSNIIRLEPNEPVFSITWCMHLRCNNDCMYCGDRHDNHSDMPSLEKLQTQWITVFEKTKHVGLPYKIALTGGELTINKDFLPFIEWLSEHYKTYIQNIGITTNGRASKNFYLRLFDKLKFISFSTHTEQMDIDKFCDTAIACNQFAKATPGKFFMINIMEEYWAEERIKYFIDFCHQNNIYYSVARIDHYRKDSRTYPIFHVRKNTEERKDLMYSPELAEQTHRAIQEHIKVYNLPDETYNNVTVYHKDGSSVPTYATRLKFLGLDNFQGWKCHAGVHRINIAADSTVYVGECENEVLGRLDDNSFRLLDNPGLCKRKTCTNNPDDIMINKSAPDLCH